MLNIDHKSYKNIILKFLSLVKFDFTDDKLGGSGKIIQIDETAPNHSIKAQGGKIPTNKTDALCIVEFEENINRTYACVKENKKASTILPTICANVASNSIIHIDEHKSYSALNNMGSVHDTVCHKCTFINPETGANTQAVESFNNSPKLDKKKEKE